MDLDGRPSAVQEFCDRLARLQREAGGPSVASLDRNGSVPLRKSQIYAVLSGEIREPPPWDFVEPFVLACAATGKRLGRRLSLSTDLEVWRAEHEQVTRAVDALRRQSRGRSTRTTVPPEAAPPPADLSLRLREAGLYIWTADDFQAGIATAADGRRSGDDPNERVDVTVLRRGRLPNLQQEFDGLGAAFDAWLDAVENDPDSDRVPVFWVVGDAGPHRSKALLACLSRAGRRGLAVFDAGVDVERAGRALEILAPSSQADPSLTAVDLDRVDGADRWSDLRSALAQARKLLSSGLAHRLRLAIAGPAEQGQQAHDALAGLVRITPVDPRGRPHQRPQSDWGMTGMASPSVTGEHAFNRGLPMTARHLFGRVAELAALTDAWASDRTKIVSIVASGGTGKSALVNTWLRRMRDLDYQGAERVLAWSFYSQGTRDNLVSADSFVNFALAWLGDDAFVTRNPWAKGVRLAELIKRYRVLLVLDGMEPLQYPLSAPDVGGRLTDDSIRSLLDELAKPDWTGLCLITTRVPLTDLSAGAETGGGTTTVQMNLDNLDDRAGADLLEHLIQSETQFRDLQQAVREVEGHALAITLLGNYIRDVHGGDLAGRFDLESLTVDVREGGHARRIMASYAKWLAHYDRTAELTVLSLIGLFDRPAPPNAMTALLADPDLRHLTGDLDEVGGDVWNRCVDALRAMGLLNHEIPDWPGTLDAHPLVREHFRDALLLRSAQTWLRANRTLYTFYADLAEPEPTDSEGMNTLYAAVNHGCAGGLHQEVFDSVLLTRVWRDRRTNYSTRLLGMTGSDLVALSHYFDRRRWTRLKECDLTHRARVLILTNAGVRLRQLGRLLDARQCFAAVASEIDVTQAEPEELENASYAAAQYCELLVIAGKLTAAHADGADTAIVSGQRAIEYADRGADAYFGMHARSSLAEAYFMLGDLERASTLFDEARQIDRQSCPRPPFGYSQSLYRYGYYLIETGQAERVLDAAVADPQWGANGDDSSLLSKAIRLLVLGAARRSILEGGETAAAAAAALRARARRDLDEAVAMLRTAGYADYVVRGLVERAHYWRICGQPGGYARALADLTTAEAEALRGHMSLLHADVVLERLACQLGFWPTMTNPERLALREHVRATLTQASGLVQQTGYGRRAEALATLRDTATRYQVSSGA